MKVQFRAPRAPDELGGLSIPYGKAQRRGKRLGWYLILALVLSPVAYLAAGAAAAALTRSAAGRVVLQQQEIRASENGVVRVLTVRPGESIRADQPLLALDSPELDAQLARATGAAADAVAAGRAVQASQSDAAAALRLAEEALGFQRRRRDTVQELVRAGAATLPELAEAQAAVQAAEASRLQAKRGLMPSASASSGADGERRALEVRRQALTARAAFDGRVLEVSVRPGSYVSRGEPLVTVASLERPRIIAYVTTRFGTRVQQGSRATVYFPDGAHMQAVVSSAPQVTARMPADLVDQFGLRPMTVLLDLAPEERWPRSQLVQGLPVTVHFRSPWEETPAGAALGATLGVLAR